MDSSTLPVARITGNKNVFLNHDLRKPMPVLSRRLSIYSAVHCRMLCSSKLLQLGKSENQEQEGRATFTVLEQNPNKNFFPKFCCCCLVSCWNVYIKVKLARRKLLLHYRTKIQLNIYFRKILLVLRQKNCGAFFSNLKILVVSICNSHPNTCFVWLKSFAFKKTHSFDLKVTYRYGTDTIIRIYIRCLIF